MAAPNACTLLWCLVSSARWLNLLQLLDAAAKVLVSVSKGVDVTPDKVAKRYTEVGAVCAAC